MSSKSLKRKVVSVLMGESQETHRCVTGCQDMTLAEKIALNASTNKQNRNMQTKPDVLEILIQLLVAV